MEYYLMYKDIKVAKIEQNGIFFKIKDIYNKEHMPIGILGSIRPVNDAFRIWFNGRNIPSYRPNYSKLLIKNNFEVEINNIHSPDITTNGQLPKMWFEDSNGKFNLLKGATSEENHEVCSEVFAYNVFKAYNIPVVPYFFTKYNNSVYSVCESFIKNDQQEFVSMEQIDAENGNGLYAGYDILCKSGFKKAIDQIDGIDYLIGNSDRHHGNIGIIRNPDTLKTLCLAPAFDNGNCMQYDYSNKRAVEDCGSKLRYRGWDEELNNIEYFDWFRNSSVSFNDLSELYHKVTDNILPRDVIVSVLGQMQNRYNFLKEYIKSREHSIVSPNFQERGDR